MSKVLSILKDLGEAVVMLLLIIIALVILVALAIPMGIVLLIGEVVSFIHRKYEERKRSNSEDMCDKESAKDSASDGDDARDTAGTESTGSDDEF
jgi:hypothetical protein